MTSSTGHLYHVTVSSQLYVHVIEHVIVTSGGDVKWLLFGVPVLQSFSKMLTGNGVLHLRNLKSQRNLKK